MSEGTTGTGTQVALPAAPEPPAQIPKVCAAWTSGQWLPLEALDAEGSDTPITDRRRRVAQVLGQTLGSDQLGVLLGLGPSAGIKGPTMSQLWREVRAADTPLFEKMQVSVGDTTSAEQAGDIEAFLSKCQQIAKAPINPNADAPTFISMAEQIIAKLCRNFLNSKDLGDHSHLLRLVTRRSAEKVRPRIFTTNYDLCIEKAAAQSGILLIDGFGHESPPLFDGGNFDVDFVRRRPEARAPEYLAGIAHLVKLHGSVDWDFEGNQIVRRENPKQPVIIYPRSDKFELSYKQPFLEAMSQLQTALRQPNLGLLVAGFSFSDAHLSEMLFTAVRKNVGLNLVVSTLDCEKHCDEQDEWNYRQKISDLRRLAERGDSRITLIDCTFGQLVRLIPDAGTETEEDRLRRLLREIV